MKQNIHKTLLSLLVACGLCNCATGSTSYDSGYSSNSTSSNLNKFSKRADLASYIIDWNYSCDAFLMRFSPYRNLLGVLLIDSSNNGYKIEIFDIYNRERIFEFEPVTMPIEDFKLNESSIMVNFADNYGTQISYDIYTGSVLWHN